MDRAVEKNIALQRLEDELRLRMFGTHTTRTYVFQNKRFFDFIKKPPERVASEDIKRYLAHLMADRGVSKTSVAVVIAALKFFYGRVLKKESLFREIKPPKREKRVPVVLTKDEVKRLLSAAGGKKSALILKLLYSSGLRLSECANLRVNDLELGEKVGWVRRGKGAKDRLFILSDAVIPDLTRYLRGHESEWLFPGREGPVTPRNIQKIVEGTVARANLTKEVSPHTLRHSFATHLLERGVDIRKIQELLGHANLSTTQIYARMSTEELKKVKSPLDTI